MRVSLTWYEIEIAAWVGVKRYVNVLQNHRRDLTGAPTDNEWQRHIVGAIGECAAGKGLRLHWPFSIGVTGGPDLIGQSSGNVEVRSSPDHRKPLIVQASDPDDRLVVLVTGEPPCFQLRGFIRAGDAKCEMFEHVGRNGKPIFVVPQSALIHISEP